MNYRFAEETDYGAETPTPKREAAMELKVTYRCRRESGEIQGYVPVIANVMKAMAASVSKTVVTPEQLCDEHEEDGLEFVRALPQLATIDN